jgi:hypothetical protein
VRLFQGSWEEQHSFKLHGRRIDPEGLSPQDTVFKVIEPSEAYTFLIDPQDVQNSNDFEPIPNPDGLPVRDHMYGSTVVDDLWTGM